MTDRLKVLKQAQKEVREIYDFLVHAKVLDKDILKLLCATEDAITKGMVATVFPQSHSGGNLFEDQALAMKGVR